MIIKGDYGTIFELEEYSHSEMPVLVTTDGGSLEIPTTDLAMFYIEYTEHHNQKPIEVNEKASKYVKLAVAAGIEHEKEKNIRLQAEKKRLLEQLIEVNMELVAQDCVMQDGSLDSTAITTYADAMRFLAKHGKITIEKEYGRRVIGYWASPEGR